MQPHDEKASSVDRELRSVDRELRRVLEPEDATVDRLVREALQAGQKRPQPFFAGWRLAAAGAVAAVLVLMVLRIPPKPIEPPEAVDVTEPSVLRISNETGLVTVTTPAGSQMIILPGDPS